MRLVCGWPSVFLLEGLATPVGSWGEGAASLAAAADTQGSKVKGEPQEPSSLFLKEERSYQRKNRKEAVSCAQAALRTRQGLLSGPESLLMPRTPGWPWIGGIPGSAQVLHLQNGDNRVPIPWVAGRMKSYKAFGLLQHTCSLNWF